MRAARGALLKENVFSSFDSSFLFPSYLSSRLAFCLFCSLMKKSTEIEEAFHSARRSNT